MVHGAANQLGQMTWLIFKAGSRKSNFVPRISLWTITRNGVFVSSDTWDFLRKRNQEVSVENSTNPKLKKDI